MVWQLQEAKNKLSEVVQKAQKNPQIITLRGQEAVAVISMQEYRKLKKHSGNIVEFFQNSPLAKASIKIERSKDKGRDIQL